MREGLEQVPTPVVVLDEGVLSQNVAAMNSLARSLGVTVRPHAKTHKCVEIARRQWAAGAVGLSVATLGEAEVFAEAGFDDLFVAYPLWVDGARATRVAALAERARLRVGVDSVEAARALGRAAHGLPGRRLEALVEVESGARRTGIEPDEVGRVADEAARAGLEVVGVFTFPGHGYRPERAAAAARDEARALARAAERLAVGGHRAEVVSGGSTPTAPLTDPAVVTEIRPGVYVFNDAQQLALGSCQPQDVALTVHSTVSSAPAPGRFVLDAGSKVLGSDRPEWVAGFGMLPDMPGTSIVALSEHHAVVRVEPGTREVAVGTRVRVVPNHVCTTVNLVDELVVTSGGEIVDRWRVDARGRNA